MSILSPENKAKLIAGIQTLGWKVAVYGLVGLSAFLSQNLDILTIPPYLTVTIGFLLGEIHSWAQNQYDLMGQTTAFVARAFKR